MTDGQADAIARYAMEIQTQQHVTGIAKVICKPNYQHADTRETRNRSLIFDAQCIQLSRRILNVGSESIRSLACKQLEVLRKDADARARVGAKFYG
jgi:hypothetical protein